MQLRQSLPRSYLFVPGDRPERFDKAWDSDADAIILDLEDAVSPDRKSMARDAVGNWLNAARPVWIRLNSADFHGFADDRSLLDCPGIAGVMLPKAEKIPKELSDLCGRRAMALMPLIETAAGIREAEALAKASSVQRLAFGSLDFQVDLGIEGDDDALLHFRSNLVLVSRLAGLAAPVDGVTPSLDVPDVLHQDATRSRRLGFGAKLCIHPKQIDTVHQVLSPSDTERAWADRVLDGMARSAGAAFALDGKMVDRPVLLKAQRIAAALRQHQRLRD